MSFFSYLLGENKSVLSRKLLPFIKKSLNPKVLRRLKTCVLVNKNLCGILYSSLELDSHLLKDLKLLQYFFIRDFSLLSCELDYFTFQKTKLKYFYSSL